MCLQQVERRLHEEALSALARSASGGPPPQSQDFEAQHREQVLEILRRSQNLDNLRRTPDFDSFRRNIDIDPIRRNLDIEALDTLRQMAPEVEARLGPLAVLEWERRVREASRRTEADITLERKDLMTVDMKNERGVHECHSSPVAGKGMERTEPEVVSTVKDEPIKIEFEQTKIPLPIRSEEMEKPPRRDSPPKFNSERKSAGILMSEEERLSFLKAVNSHASVYTRDHSPVTSTVRVPPSADLLHSSLNNNIFPFPPYPPLWPSMLPFPPLTKFYPPFGGTMPPALEGFKNSVFGPSFDAANSRNPHRLSKEETATKKRFLDAVLQVQRQNEGAIGGVPTTSSSSRAPQHPPATASPSVSSPSVTSSNLPIGTSHDQPMDLTVRRKRKMDKSEIIYNPGEDIETDDTLDTEDLYKVDEKWLKREEEVIEEVEEVVEDEEEEEIAKPEEFLDSGTENTSEVPLKLIKLDSPGETLVA